ncbi:hypothetical protein FACS1894101_1480 [Betaproteobacteria bacterium]|nr:hypothetical protein FACS1894101_1480 [Betaproteobacteria bacterium]
MTRLLRIAALTLILALLIPALLGRLSIKHEYEREFGEGQNRGVDQKQVRSAHRATLTKGEQAISALAGHHRVAASNRRADNLDGLLVAASDYAGEVVVVAGEHSQLYVFKKKNDAYQLKQVLWDGKTGFPVSLAITENARYAVMMTAEMATLPGIGNGTDSILRSMGRNLPPQEMKKPTLMIWDLEKEEKTQEVDTQMLGIARNEALITSGRQLVMKRGFPLMDADYLSKNYVPYSADTYINIPKELLSPDAFRKVQAAYAPLARQILVKNSSQNNFLRYKVRDESGGWKFWSNEVSLEKLPGDFLVCPADTVNCTLDTLFPAFEVSPDGNFFVILRDNGSLEAYSLPNGILRAQIKTGKRMNDPQLTIVEGTVYLTNSRNFPTGNNASGFWSWKPGDTELRLHFLQCADYTRLLNNGHIATLGCSDKGNMELRLVALADNARIQSFSQPLRLKW